MSTIKRNLINWLFPYTCILCSNQSLLPQDLCHQCEIDLPWLKDACVRCATPLSQTGHCGSCLQSPPYFHNTYALFHYQYPIDHLILGLKFADQFINAKILGQLLVRKLQLAYQHKKPDLIIPVPLHQQRHIERGFNQALELARPIAKSLKIPLSINNCSRKKATVAQSTIPAKHRQQNVEHAFTMTADVLAKHILIIDDVMTTGYTMNALCKTLSTTHIERIDVGCIARAG